MSDRFDERAFIAEIVARNSQLPPGILIPPGDDMAQLLLPDNSILVSVDQIVEGVHFTSGTSLDLIARKAIARNVSDVAAMAGIPLATLAAAVIPKAMTSHTACELLKALREKAAEFGCPLIGGDTTMHVASNAPLTISVTILATLRSDGIVVRRDGAQPGDHLLVSGTLGGSLDKDGQGRHLTFSPRLEHAHRLVDELGNAVHAMIDISDGLGRDCAALIDSSSRRCGRALQGVLDSVDGACTPGCSELQALGDGEDHELLVAVAHDAVVPAGWIPVGKVTLRAASSQPMVLARVGAEYIDASEIGWNHE